MGQLRGICIYFISCWWLLRFEHCATYTDLRCWLRNQSDIDQWIDTISLSVVIEFVLCCAVLCLATGCCHINTIRIRSYCLISSHLMRWHFCKHYRMEQQKKYIYTNFRNNNDISSITKQPTQPNNVCAFAIWIFILYTVFCAGGCCCCCFFAHPHHLLLLLLFLWDIAQAIGLLDSVRFVSFRSLLFFSTSFALFLLYFSHLKIDESIKK